MRHENELPKSKRVLAALVVLLQAIPTLSYARVSKASNKSGATEILSCWAGAHFEDFRSRQAISSTLQSRDGRFSAYIKVEAIAHPAKDRKSPPCENHTSLFLVRDSKDPELIFPANGVRVTAFGDSRDWLEGMRLVDWSADDRLLLVDAISWTYESDSGSQYNPLIYDVSSGLFQQPPIQSALKKYFKNECDFEIRSEGFSPGNGLVIRLKPALPDPNDPDEASCVKHPGLFLYNGTDNSIHQLPTSYKIHRNGSMSTPARQ